jgi:hypothetical protein
MTTADVCPLCLQGPDDCMCGRHWARGTPVDGQPPAAGPAAPAAPGSGPTPRDWIMETATAGPPAASPGASPRPRADPTAGGDRVTLAYLAGGPAAVVNRRHLLRFRLTVPAGPLVRATITAKLDGQGSALRCNDDDLRGKVTVGPGVSSGEFHLPFTAVGAGEFGVRSLRLVVETDDGSGVATATYELADHSVCFTVEDPRSAAPNHTTVTINANDILGSSLPIHAAAGPAEPTAAAQWVAVPLDGPLPADGRRPSVMASPPPPPAAERPARPPQVQPPRRSPAPPPATLAAAVASLSSVPSVTTAALQREAERPRDFTTKVWITAADAPADAPAHAVGIGDRFLLWVYSDERSYFTVLSTDADGQAYLLLQDEGITTCGTKAVRGMRSARSPNALIVWRAAPPVGPQQFFAFFTDKPVAAFGPAAEPGPVSSVTDALAAFRRPPASRRSACRVTVDVCEAG